MAANLTIRSRADAPHLRKAGGRSSKPGGAIGYLRYTWSHYEYYAELLDAYPEYQLCLVDEDAEYPVAVANSVPSSVRSLTISPRKGGTGWSRRPLARRYARQYARRLGRFGPGRPSLQGLCAGDDPLPSRTRRGQGLDGVVVPVRPSAKVRHPWVSIADYMAWTDENGRPYDPWLRSHLSAGGKLVGPCERSMVVQEPIAFWENWSKERFERSGAYPLEGALAPVKIDSIVRPDIRRAERLGIVYGLKPILGTKPTG